MIIKPHKTMTSRGGAYAFHSRMKPDETGHVPDKAHWLDGTIAPGTDDEVKKRWRDQGAEHERGAPDPKSAWIAHLSINPSSKDHLSDQQLCEIAKEVRERLYKMPKNNAFLVVRHGQHVHLQMDIRGCASPDIREIKAYCRELEDRLDLERVGRKRGQERADRHLSPMQQIIRTDERDRMEHRITKAERAAPILAALNEIEHARQRNDSMALLAAMAESGITQIAVENKRDPDGKISTKGWSVTIGNGEKVKGSDLLEPDEPMPDLVEHLASEHREHFGIKLGPEGKLGLARPVPVPTPTLTKTLGRSHGGPVRKRELPMPGQ